MDPNPNLTPMYLKWLHNQAVDGERDALAELRRLLIQPPAREFRFDQSLTCASDPVEPPPTPQDYAPRIEANGVIVFRVAGRDAVRDAGQSLIVLDRSDEADDMAIALAVVKFHGQALRVGGDAEFKKRMLGAALRSHRVVQFEDPTLQRQLEAGLRLRSQDMTSFFGPGLAPTLVPSPVASATTAKSGASHKNEAPEPRTRRPS